MPFNHIIFSFGRQVNHQYLEQKLLATKYYNRLSRKQFTIEKFRNGKVVITNNSQCGTFIQKKKLGLGQTKELQQDDVIAIGDEDFEAFIFTKATGVDDSMKIPTPKASRKTAESDFCESSLNFSGFDNEKSSLGSIFSRTPSKKTQRSDVDEPSLDGKRTRNKKKVQECDSLTGKSLDEIDESVISGSQGGTTKDDGESLILHGKRERRPPKKHPDFEY